MSLAELDVDPRTGLKIVPVPNEYAKYFADLTGSIIHWFGSVIKFNQKWTEQNRIAIISNRCVYLCHTNGGITRCVQIQNIECLFLSPEARAPYAIGFKVAHPDYDMLIAVGDKQERQRIVDIISKIFSISGSQLDVRKMDNRELAEQSMQNAVQLKKPSHWVLRIEPLQKISSLAKQVRERKELDEKDRQLVEAEYERIKRGLIHELNTYRGAEFQHMLVELERREKLLRERDNEIAELKRTHCSRDDPEIWRSCPNCKKYRSLLESSGSEDKQKLYRLQKDLESQRHIVHHLQAALLHRTAANNGAGGLPGDSAPSSSGRPGSTAGHPIVTQLQEQLDLAKLKNRELQQLILDSPFLTSGVKQQALVLSYTDPTMMMGTGGQSAASVAGGALGSGGNNAGFVNSAVLLEKDREIQHLKAQFRDATFQHLREIDHMRREIQRFGLNTSSVSAARRETATSDQHSFQHAAVVAVNPSDENALFTPGSNKNVPVSSQKGTFLRHDGEDDFLL